MSAERKRRGWRDALLPALVFCGVFLAHALWTSPEPAEQAIQSQWAAVPAATVADRLDRYLAAQDYWLGFSYAITLAFAAAAGRAFLTNWSRRDRAAALGGLTAAGLLWAGGCFLIGCCGSPMLIVYLNLLGIGWLPVVKPLIALATLLMVGAAWAWRYRTVTVDQSIATGVPGAATPVTTVLTAADRWGAIRMRFNLGRTRYTVAPGLYSVGAPTAESPVLVSANYKLSFDCLRRELTGRSAWLLVLDTRGINVWCAAGKGTFGTAELVHRLAAVGLDRIVAHRTLIVPQLGAPGVAAHEVRRQSGFTVVYGPVYARDLGAFLDAGRRATLAMRRVRFGLWDRLVVVPVELVQGSPRALLLAAGFLLFAGLGPYGLQLAAIISRGFPAALLILGAFLAGSVLTPLLLPWLPFRAFAAKGAVLGLALAAGLILAGGVAGGGLEKLSWLLLVPAISAFVAMNYTGASSITSRSGVEKEIKYALPLERAAGGGGLLLWLAAPFAG